MKTFEDFGITNLRGSGVERRTTCPQCSSSRKNKKALCLDANMDKGIWNCHHCGWSGTLKKGADNSSNPYLWVKREYTKPLFIPKDPEAQMLDWFKKRGITEEVVKRNQITREVIYMPQVEDQVPAICFPLFRKGKNGQEEVVNIKYRDKNKNFRGVGGAERIFYGLRDIEDITFIVEGELDKLALEVAGYKNCISVPDGAPSLKAKDYSSKFDFLENCKEELSLVKSFVIAVDNDAAGKKLEEELARRLGKEKCLKVQGWPEGCKDANDVLIKYGVEALQDILCNLHDFAIDGIADPDNVADMVRDLYHNGVTQGVMPYWSKLKEFYTVKPGYMTIVTGIPQHGKSEWLDGLLINIAKSEGWKFAFYSPENHPIPQHVSKLVEKFVEKKFDKSFLNAMSAEEMEAGNLFVKNHFRFFGSEDHNATSLDEILLKAEQLVFQQGITGLVLDPWNEIDHQRPSNLSETEYISKCLTKVRYFARKCGVHVWIVAHPVKMERVNGKQPIPTPYHISGSSHWYNKADNCITIYRDIDLLNSPTRVYIQKVKPKYIGKLGRILMDYKINSGCYSECEYQKLADEV